tara:strand:- start:278 stop:901 length:624 start_codon:yes stop_codon:yes gene_type:complete
MTTLILANDNTKTHAFASANLLASHIESELVSKMDVIAILQARKDRKISRNQEFKGKSAKLLNKLLGIEVPRPHATPAQINSLMAASEVEVQVIADRSAKAEVMLAEDKEMAYLMKLESASKKQIESRLLKVKLEWKKNLLLGALEQFGGDVPQAVRPHAQAEEIVARVDSADAALSLTNLIQSINPTMTTAQCAKVMSVILGANAA